ncbi:MAG: ribosome maturation factor RimM [Elusimicrobia bacterium]|nr:ribosome maturation factor RimM [Elusimicrobiota bacterium]
MLKVGYVVRHHGMKGELLVCLDTKCSPALPRKVFLERAENLLGPFEISRVRRFGPSSQSRYLISFKNSQNFLDTRFRKLSGYCIGVKIRKLPAETYWVDDLINCEVFNTAGEKLGVIDKVIRTGANDVYVVGEIMIPALKKVIRKVDIKNKKVVVDYNECEDQN